MGIETLQKAALAAGFVMATPDDDPPGDELYADSTENDWQLATGRSLVPLSEVPSRRAGARESLATAAAWIKDRLSMNGGRAPA